MQLFHVTIAGNVTGSLFGGGAVYRATNAGVVSVWNSILADNFAGIERDDCNGGTLRSQDYNLIQSAASGCPIEGPIGNGVYDRDAMLDALRDNGGAVPTRALLAGSPALDQIPAPLCRDSTGAAPTADQKGTLRPIGTRCDIGAFEGARLPTLFGRNLIRNGDAEDGGGSPTGAVVGVPSWSRVQDLTVVTYGAAGGFPGAGDALPTEHGYNFFAGGTTGVAGGLQDIDVAAIGTFIDAGAVSWSMSGDFGGWRDQDDYAPLFIRFLDARGGKIGTESEPFIGMVTAADRGNATGFRHRSGTGLVPAGTRTIHVGLTIRRDAFSGYNDGYADNLSLVLSTGTGARATAVEYRHAAFDHYFLTAIPDEIAKLDGGVFQGWTRVGEAFTVFSDTPSSSSTVCRFFSTAFDPKSSHFYAVDTTECDIVKRNKDWQFEGNVFNLRVPSANGTCSSGWVPVYRLYNNGQGNAPNHRYTTSLTIRSQMLDAGWIPEGQGIGVAMCAPP